MLIAYRASNCKKLIPLIFKLPANLLLKFDNSHVNSQQDVVNCVKEDQEFHATFYRFVNSCEFKMHLTPTVNYRFMFYIS